LRVFRFALTSLSTSLNGTPTNNERIISSIKYVVRVREEPSIVGTSTTLKQYDACPNFENKTHRNKYAKQMQLQQELTNVLMIHTNKGPQQHIFNVIWRYFWSCSIRISNGHYRLAV
jgi:hypothetical protein